MTAVRRKLYPFLVFSLISLWYFMNYLKVQMKISWFQTYLITLSSLILTFLKLCGVFSDFEAELQSSEYYCSKRITIIIRISNYLSLPVSNSKCSKYMHIKFHKSFKCRSTAFFTLFNQTCTKKLCNFHKV